MNTDRTYVVYVSRLDDKDGYSQKMYTSDDFEDALDKAEYFHSIGFVANIRGYRKESK